ncbi:hypothetical protein VAR608DRAFT_0360 [Variovorax sp. HW608]|uniref:hypothetical protein n=1 Tax=Variovorax sp. HW608 TaxID=1034889 RepID=UPI00081FC28E|nr:hypothetical protein [Variovorax sp. HW608]SCK09618.1 hypothetical protein VAR608DRAFT_0360 [Variovorax sp. HW608]
MDKKPWIWSAKWIFPYEGPYTQLAKLAVVNRMDERKLSRVLFKTAGNGGEIDGDGLHARSLLIEHRGIRPPAQLAQAGLHLDQSMLGRLSPKWYRAIAGDEQFRYCRTCLGNGFAASVFQIDALARCPIHDEPLKSTCVSCGAPTARYALTAAAFSVPMRCVACHAMLAPAWTLTDMIINWRRPLASRRLTAMHRWLLDVSAASIDADRIFDWPNRADPAERRLAAFEVLRRLVPLNLAERYLRSRPSRVRQVSSRTFERVTKPSPDSERSRRQVYKSMRRHFARCFGVDARHLHWPLDNHLYTDRFGHILARDGRVSPDVHGFHLWRLRFESAPIHSGLRPLGFSLSLRDVARLPHLITGDLPTWGGFVLACLKADLASTARWQERVGSPERNAAPEYEACAAWTSMLREFAADLSPTTDWPNTVAWAILSDSSGLSARSRIIVVYYNEGRVLKGGIR